MFFEIGVLKYFAIFTGKHLRWSLFLIKFIKTLFNTGIFLWILRKNFKNSYFYRTPPVVASVDCCFIPAVYLEPFQTLMMELFTKLVNYYQPSAVVHIETSHLICLQIKWLVSIRNATLGWNGLTAKAPHVSLFRCLPCFSWLETHTRCLREN